MADSLLPIEAQPSSITMDIARTALLVVDMQNDFGTEGGVFDRAGIDISIIREVIGPISATIAAARGAGIPVIYIKMGFRPDPSDAGAPDSPNRLKHGPMGIGDAIAAPDGTQGRILVRDTW